MPGLINDSRTVKHTVFSDLTEAEQLTGLDYLLIKLLYSPYLRSGMDARQAAPLVRHQLELWELTGEIQRASRMALEGLRLAECWPLTMFLPVTHAPGIDVDEIAFGVVADTTCLQ